jgi:CelD/BcsL family acetyltransferase involved in cellulose biosynthesis
MAAMKIQLLHPRELDSGLTARWHQLLGAPDVPQALHGPFFTPEFAQLVGEVRPRSRVAVIEVDGCVAGFHAFEPGPLGIASPLAGRMSDAHGPVLDTQLDLDPGVWLRQCGLRSWRFDHLPVAFSAFEPFETSRSRAWLLCLDGGFKAYRERIEERSSWIRRTAPKLRRLERQFGPLRFELNTHDSQAWASLARWKSAQYRRSAVVDNFSIPWVCDYLQRLRHAQSPALTGLMSALYAGDRLAAVHLGMRSQRVWHHYLPTFDRELAPFSPGLGLLLRMVEQAPDLGIEMLDFSSGDMDYKRSASTDCVELAQGAVEPAWMRATRRQGRRAVARLRTSAPVLSAARSARRTAIALLNASRPAATLLRR